MPANSDRSSWVAYDAEPGEVAALRAGDLIGLIAQQPVLEGQMSVKMGRRRDQGHQAGPEVQRPAGYTDQARDDGQTVAILLPHGRLSHTRRGEEYVFPSS